MNHTISQNDPWWPVRRAIIRLEGEVLNGNNKPKSKPVKALGPLARAWNVSLVGALARCEDQWVFDSFVESDPGIIFDDALKPSVPRFVLAEKATDCAPPIVPPAWCALYDERYEWNERDMERVVHAWSAKTRREPPVWRGPSYNSLGELKLGVVKRHVSEGDASKRLRVAAACESEPLAHVADVDLAGLLASAVEEARRNGVVVLQRPYRIEEIDLILEVYRSRFMTSHECR